MEKECDGLRQAITAWTERKFTVMGGTFVVVPAILGWIISSPKNWSWEIGAVLPLCILFSACYLTWLFNKYGVMIGSYLEVFHENKWEERSRQFSGVDRWLDMNTALGALYFGLGIVSIFVTREVCMASATTLGLVLFFIVLFLFLFTVRILAFHSFPRDLFLARWKQIKEDESRGASQ